MFTSKTKGIILPATITRRCSFCEENIGWRFKDIPRLGTTPGDLQAAGRQSTNIYSKATVYSAPLKLPGKPAKSI